LYGHTRDIGQNQTGTTGLAGTYGGAMKFPSAQDFSNALFSTNLSFPAGSSAVDNSGYRIYFRDTSGNWALISLYNEATGAADAFRPFVSFLPNETIEEGSVTPIDWSIVDYVGVACIVTTTSGSSIARSVIFRPIMRIPLSGGAVPVVGGSASDPFSFRDIANVLLSGVSYRSPSIQGAKQQLFLTPVQIGDGGTSPTYFKGSAGSAEFADATYRGARYGLNALEARLKLGASDSFRFGSSSLGSGEQQAFVIDPATSASAIDDFGGTIFGLSVTLIDGITVSGTAFLGCPEIDAQTATITNCTITETTSTDAAIAFDGNCTITDTVIDVTGTSAAYHLELGTAVTAATITGCTFTGTPGTDKVHVKRTTGTVTITSENLVAGDITSDGATVVLSNPDAQVISLPSLADGTRVRVYNETTDTEIANAVVAGGAGYSITLSPGVNYTNGDTIRWVSFHANGATYYYPQAGSLTAATGTYTFSDAPVLWAEPNTVSLDWTTVTECATDYVNVEVEVTDPDDVGYKSRYAIFVTGSMSTADGIRNWISLTGVPVIDWITGASVRIDTTIASVAITNVKAASILRVTDTFAFNWSDGVDDIGAVLGSSLVWKNAVDVAVVETGTSGLTAGEAAQLAKLDSITVTGGAVDANVAKVNGYAVTGTGQPGSTWGPA
jgi:hypothetical protein